jgi:DNA-binding XRE family transcriptional regulator
MTGGCSVVYTASWRTAAHHPHGLLQYDGYNPLVYNHHSHHTKPLMPRRRQIQPRFGPEKAFGIVLREIRQAAGLSQMDVDVQFEIDRTYLSAIERGIQSPTLRMIVRLCDAFRVSPSDLMRRMEISRLYRR